MIRVGYRAENRCEVGREFLRATEGVPLPLHDQRRDPRVDGLPELGKPGPVRPPGRMQREGERNDAACFHVRCRPAGDARAGAPTADNERARHRHLLKDGQPAAVERRGWRRHPTPGYPPRLLDPDHGHAERRQRRRERGEIGCIRPATGTVAEHQRDDQHSSLRS